jgi:hypothetical protein
MYVKARVLLYSIKLDFILVRALSFYSEVTCSYWMAILVFSPILFDWISKTTVTVSVSIAVPPFTWIVFNYMYYITLHDIVYCFLVRRVMWVGLHPSKYSLERADDTIYSDLPWVLHNWRLSGGVKQRTFCGEESFTLYAVFKMFIAFYKYYDW